MNTNVGGIDRVIRIYCRHGPYCMGIDRRPGLELDRRYTSGNRYNKVLPPKKKCPI
jgi:hypothetical protein